MSVASNDRFPCRNLLIRAAVWFWYVARNVEDVVEPLALKTLYGGQEADGVRESAKDPLFDAAAWASVNESGRTIKWPRLRDGSDR